MEARRFSGGRERGQAQNVRAAGAPAAWNDEIVARRGRRRISPDNPKGAPYPRGLSGRCFVQGGRGTARLQEECVMPEELVIVGSDHVSSLTGLVKHMKKKVEELDQSNPAVIKVSEELEAVEKELDPKVLIPGKTLLTDKAWLKPKNRITLLLKLVDKLIKTSKKGSQPVGWEASISNDVKKWCQSTGELAIITKVLAEIRAYGEAAGGLRKIKGSLFDIKCKKATDYRVVGELVGTSIEFTAVYRHAKGGGKEFVDGKRISAYG
jgi:hypothetical protein